MILFKISEACEKVQHRMKIIDPEQPAHIMHVKLQSRFFKLPAEFNVTLAEIHSGHLNAFRMKMPGMTALSATQVENSGARFQLQLSAEMIQKFRRFLVVAVGVKNVIIR